MNLAVTNLPAWSGTDVFVGAVAGLILAMATAPVVEILSKKSLTEKQELYMILGFAVVGAATWPWARWLK